MQHEEEERKQNWMLRTDSKHVPRKRNLLYGRESIQSLFQQHNKHPIKFH